MLPPSPPLSLALLYVAGGGALGSVLRYLLSVWLEPVSRGFPVSILLVNVLGSFAITYLGALTVPGGAHALSGGARLALLVGVCGGFTTFSSFSLQTLDLLRAGFLGRAALNVVASVLLCLLEAALGYVLGSRPAA